MTLPDAPSFRSAALSNRRPTQVKWIASPEACAWMADALGAIRIEKLSFVGEIKPQGSTDFRLVGKLKANVDQACVVTLVPVRASIHEEVVRVYQRRWVEPDDDEIELTDDSLEPLPETIEVAEMVREALALALPPYPRIEGATLNESVFGPPDVAPLQDADLNPFAALAGLVTKN